MNSRRASRRTASSNRAPTWLAIFGFRALRAYDIVHGVDDDLVKAEYALIHGGALDFRGRQRRQTASARLRRDDIVREAIAGLFLQQRSPGRPLGGPDAAAGRVWSYPRSEIWSRAACGHAHTAQEHTPHMHTYLVPTLGFGGYLQELAGSFG